MTDKLRLFVALELPDDVRAALPTPGEGWRALSGDHLHVTLTFLGWRPAEDALVATAALHDALRPVGTLSLGDPVLLPPRAPRVMAVRLVDPEGLLGALQTAVSDRLAHAGIYVPEKRPFLPHVTIGRTRERVRRDAPVPAVPDLAFEPSTVTLFRSVLHPHGARYEALERLALPSR